MDRELIERCIESLRNIGSDPRGPDWPAGEILGTALDAGAFDGAEYSALRRGVARKREAGCRARALFWRVVHELLYANQNGLLAPEVSRVVVGLRAQNEVYQSPFEHMFGSAAEKALEGVRGNCQILAELLAKKPKAGAAPQAKNKGGAPTKWDDVRELIDANPKADDRRIAALWNQKNGSKMGKNGLEKLTARKVKGIRKEMKRKPRVRRRT